MDVTDDIARRHIFSVLVANEPGVTARIAGVLSGRGYNIESFVGAEIDHEHGLSCITLVTWATDAVIEQVKAQLERLVPVHSVRDLGEEGPHSAVELALVKLRATVAELPDLRKKIEAVGGRFVEANTACAVFEITDSTEKVDRFVAFLASLGHIQVVRTGTVAISLDSPPI